MNILQAFYITFKSDAQKVQKETQDAERAAEKLAGALDRAGDQGAAAGAEIASGMRTAAAATSQAAAASTAGAAAQAGAANSAKVAMIGMADAHVVAWQAARKRNDEEEHVHQRMKLRSHEVVGITRQLADIAVTAPMMPLWLIALQQGPQLLDQLQMINSRGVTTSTVFSEMGRMAGNLAKPLTGLILPLTAIGALLIGTGIAKGQVDFLTNMGKIAEKTNDSVENVDAVSRSIRNMGGSSKEAQEQLGKFAGKIEEAFGDAKSSAGKVFAGLKLNVAGGDGNVKSTTAVLAELAGALENVSKKKAAATLQKLGITDEATIRLIMRGKAAVEAQIAAEKALGVTTTEQVERAKKYKHEVDLLTDAFTDLKNMIAGALLPGLTATVKVFKDMVEWIAANRVMVGAFFSALVVGITLATAALWGAYIPAMVSAAVATLVAFAPFFLIAAAVIATAALIAAVVDDLSAYFKGQPSLIGELINRYKWLRDAIQMIGDAFKITAKTAGGAWDAIVSVGSDAFRTLWGVAGPIFRLFFDVVSALARFLGPILAAAGRLGFGVIVEWVSKTTNDVTNFVGFIVQAAKVIGDILAAVAGFLGPIWIEMFDQWLTRVYALIAGVRKLFGLKPDAQVNAVLSGAAKPGDLPPPPPPANAPGVVQGQRQMGAARTAPLAAQTSASMATRSAAVTQRTNQIKIDKIEVNTKATDPEGIAKGISGALGNQVRAATAAFDNGVER